MSNVCWWCCCWFKTEYSCHRKNQHKMLKKLRFDPKLCTDAFQSEITAQLYTCDIPRLWNGFSFCLVATIRLISDQLVFLKNYQITKLISLGWVLSTLQKLWILKRWLRKESIHVIASAISFWFVLKGMVTLFVVGVLNFSCTMIKIVDIFWQMENASHEGGNPGENQ